VQVGGSSDGDEILAGGAIDGYRGGGEKSAWFQGFQQLERIGQINLP
jgi:hypothetical protein